jgi:phosphohistidine phosphatase
MKKNGSPILLVRHAKAEPEHPSGDWARSLTAKGRKSFAAHARVLAEHCSLRGIATSPWVRAVQTAEILAEAAGLRNVQSRGELIPDRNAPARILKLAQELGPGWALVGHNPSLEDAAASALGIGKWPLNLKKGAAVALRWQGGSFTFVWQACPKKALVKRLGISPQGR